MMIHGMMGPPTNDDTDQFSVFLTRALQFSSGENGQREPRDILAGVSIDIPRTQDFTANGISPAYGGAFPNVVARYIALTYAGVVQNPEDARSKLPPSLLHEGERVQPEWLFQFLRNPGPVRPETWMALRMPKFNMSEDEARTLVDYFAATDRLSNPGIGLTSPYVLFPQREEKYWRDKTREYMARLKPELIDARRKELEPLWKLAKQDELADLNLKIEATKKSIEDADKALKAAGSDEAKKTAAQLAKDNAAQDLKSLEERAAAAKAVIGGDFGLLEREWKDTGMYFTDGYRVLAQNNFCSKCHNIGDLKIQGAKGPDLDKAYQRLRPDWTRRWVVHPQRLLPYGSPMPQNFTVQMEPELRKVFEGDRFEQLTALRDVLMNFPKVADMPANRYYRPSEGGK
jgi:hypothetical protein